MLWRREDLRAGGETIVGAVNARADRKGIGPAQDTRSLRADIRDRAHDIRSIAANEIVACARDVDIIAGP